MGKSILADLMSDPTLAYVLGSHLPGIESEEPDVSQAAEVEEPPAPVAVVVKSSPARAPFTAPPKPEPIRRVTVTKGRFGPTTTIEIEPLLWSPIPPLENLLDTFPASRREEIRAAVKSNPQGMGILYLMHCRGCDRYDALEMLGLNPWEGWVADEVENIEETAA